MAKPAKSENVPKAMQEKFDWITAITDEFAQAHLNDEYAQLMRQATAALCRKRPSPLASGKEKTWACGIAHAIGMVNFLFDSTQIPHLSARDLYAWFGVGVSTGQGKSKQIRDLLDMHQLDPAWCLPSLIGQNPMAWTISVDGLLVDARNAPRDVQEALAAAGLIPYVPGAQAAAKAEPEDTAPPAVAKPARKRKEEPGTVSSAPVPSPAADAVYILQVNVLDGPITEEFIEENPQVSRTIEIKGNQTLKDLHQAIFKALDREEEHMYEFQVGGQGPNDPHARRYGQKQAFSLPGEPPAGDVAKTQMNDLGLTVGEVFGYWFDFGDDWWHAVAVMEVKEKAGKGKYPKVTHRIGASPPQYADFD